MSWVLGWLLVALVALLVSPLLAGWPLWAVAALGVPVVLTVGAGVRGAFRAVC